MSPPPYLALGTSATTDDGVLKTAENSGLAGDRGPKAIFHLGFNGRKIRHLAVASNFRPMASAFSPQMAS
jgi:hypothetical protein